MNAIFTVVDKLLKEWYYIFCHIKNKWILLKKTVWLFICEMFCYHNLPQSIISDQSSQFISRMWKSLLKQLNINPLILISHHPETDSQTEHFNQKVKIGLCLYINHLQDNWICWLSVVEFIDNNAVNRFIKITLFYFNKGFNSCMFFNSDIIKTVIMQKKLQICSVSEIVRIMNKILLVACDNLIKAQSDIVKQANYWCCVENFVVGDEVMVNTWNLVSN